MLILRNLSIAICLTLTVATPALSFTLPLPTKTPILTVTGAIKVTNVDDRADLDIDILRSIGTETISTSTIWTQGVHEFTGVPLRDLMDALQAEGSKIHAKAINDYAVVIPMSDAMENGPIIAFEMDGKAMSVREKGPFWIIYPYDQSNAYRSGTIYTRSIWQLVALDVVE